MKRAWREKMKNIIKIFLADARRLSKNVVAVVIVMGLCIIPSLYAWFNIFSNWDPYGPDSTSNLKVAVVSLDEGSTISGMELNVGDTVIEGLKSNNTIGWVFTDTEDEAVNGVNNGDYYAALVVPKDFTEDMISFLGGDIKHPEITYYENEKKNAIAPKITGKAKTAVQEQVNSTFVSTLAEGVMEVSNVLSGQEDGNSGIFNTVTDKLTELQGNLQLYSNLLASFIGITNSASNIMATSQAVLPNLNDMVNNGKNTINSIQDAALNNAGSSESLLDMVSYSFELVDNALEDLKNTVQTDLGAISNQISGNTSIGNSTITGMQTALPYIRQLFNNAVSGWADETTQPKIDEINQSLDKIEADLSQLSNSQQEVSNTTDALKDSLIQEITSCQNQLKALKDSFEYSVRPALRSTMNSVQGSLLDVQSLLGSMDGDFSEVEDVLAEYESVLQGGTEGLQESKEKTDEVIANIGTIITNLKEFENDDQYQELVDMLKTDPKQLADFISSPVSIQTEQMYPIDNYGSAMAPFYTILALWVGALILVAIVHVKVHPEEGITNVKPYQKYFGRYIFFFLVGQVQTLITVLGEIFYIKIQCPHPFLFWLAAAVSSFVFTIFIYSLTVAFGNVGEAIAVVVMVIQVAGAGGTFPIETLPKVYQYTYKYLPFPYGMNAMRECIGGMHGADYLRYIGVMGIYVVISLVIGLLLAIPFRKMNERIEHSKERSDVMI